MNRNIYEASFSNRKLEELLRSGVDIDTRDDRYGWTALHLAARNGNLSATKLLVTNKADVDLKSKDGQTALDIAEQFHGLGGSMARSVVAALLRNPHRAAQIERENEAARVAMDPYEIYRKAKDGGLEELLRAGVDIDTCDDRGKTALHYAVDDSDVPAATLLVANNADVGLKNKWGDTALHSAAKAKGSLQVVTFLVGSNADVDLKNEWGKTALDCAEEFWNGAEVAAFLRIPRPARQDSASLEQALEQDLARVEGDFMVNGKLMRWV